jgi:hypothetical protein
MDIIYLKEYEQKAVFAFYWTSFTPEKRGAQTTAEHENMLLSDLSGIPEDEQERYIEGFKKHYAAWLAAHGDCASSAITGGSGFNVRRAERANNRERAAYEAFTLWRGKVLKATAKRTEDAKPDEQRTAEAWENLRSTITRTAGWAHAKGYNKALFVASIYGKVETYARRGDVAMVERAIELVRELNKSRSFITERHKFFGLAEVAAGMRDAKAENASRESHDVSFEGGAVRLNHEVDRVQILFDAKPSSGMIAELKRNGFKWSPRFGAWQRQHTQNALHAVGRLLNIKI